jgi:VWFA-related protein
MIRIPAVLLVLPALLAGIRPAAAADLGERTPGGVRAAVEVEALDLDVVVTKNGAFVDDLTKDDFVVKIDGTAVPLDYFTRVEEGSLLAPDLSKAPPDLILDSARNDGGGRYLPRQVLVFFDDEHLMPFERPRVIEGLKELVLKLSPPDQAAILRYDRGSTRALVPFTGSKEELLDGLSRLGTLTPGGFSWFAQERQEWNTARTMRSYTMSQQNIIRSFAAEAKRREQVVLTDLRRAVSALAARSGKRTLVYVGSGIELHPGEAFARSFGSGLQPLGPGVTGLQPFEYDVTKEYGAVLAEANASGVTIYVIDARGLTTDVTDAGEESVPDLAPFERNMLRKEALAGFAAETGGAFFQNRNEFKGAAQQIYRETSTFYSIGVTLSNLPKRNEHSIKVTVNRPGVAARTRSAFVPMSPGKAVLNRMELALVTPDAKGEFDIAVSVGPSRSGGLARRISPLEVRVPLSELTFQDAGGRKEAVVDITVAAVEDNGARSSPATVRRTISLDPARWEQDRNRYYLFTSDLKSRSGNHRIVVTVKDVATSRMGLGSASVRID